MGCCNEKHEVLIQPKTTNTEGLPPSTYDPIFVPILKSNTSDIREYYSFKKVIGRGHFGTVRLAHRLESPSSVFAVKTIVKKRVKSEQDILKREISILFALDHPNIIKLYEVFEDTKYYHLVTEYCSGGELFTRIVERGKFDEAEAAKLMQKILLAINNLHSNNICHRDLKPENFLFESSDPAAELKLIDFGLSNKFFNKFGKVEMHSIVGTPYYVAPEVLKGGYGPKCDIWSAGVIMYVLLSGGLPFNGTNDEEIYSSILKGKFEMSNKLWSKITPQAKELCRQMMVINPQSRLSAEEALNHKWFSMQPSLEELEIDPVVLEALRTYEKVGKFQQEAYETVVKHLNVKQIRWLKETFLALDVSKKGYLDFHEIERGLEEAGFNPAGEEIHSIISNADYRGDGRINYSEFIAATINLRSVIDGEMLWNTFCRFDTDGSGYITQENLEEAFRRSGKEFTSKEVEAMIKEHDSDNTARISFQEFKSMFKKAQCGIRETHV